MKPITASGVQEETGAIGSQTKMTREDWIKKHLVIELQSIRILTPDNDSVDLEAGGKLIRIGSIWHADEEYHIFVMEEVILQAKEAVSDMTNEGVAVLTPLWIFKRLANTIKADENPVVLNLAERNFLRMLNEILGDNDGH